MKRHQSVLFTIAVVAAAATLSTGCVSKKLFRETTESTDSRVGAVESGVEENQRRIDDMRTETDKKIAEMGGKVENAREVGNQAMQTAKTAAEKAEQAAKGKLLWEVTLSDDRVKFSFDQASIPDAAKAELDALAGKIKGYGKAVYLEIEGHTDSQGSEEYNYMLGEKRANAVRNYLNAQAGIPLHAMNTISLGESAPVADNGTMAGRAQNRRVVIRVLE